MRWGVVSTLSNQWWMAGAGHLASLRGTGVGHYETAATRSLQRQSSQPKVGLPITHLIKETNRNLLHLRPYRVNSHTHFYRCHYYLLVFIYTRVHIKHTHTHTHTHSLSLSLSLSFSLAYPPGPSDVIDPLLDK